MTGSRLVATSLSHPLTDPCQFDMIAQDQEGQARGKLTFILARDRKAVIEAKAIMIAASVSFPGVGATEVAGRR
jgi:hypothetical protein